MELLHRNVPKPDMDVLLTLTTVAFLAYVSAEDPVYCSAADHKYYVQQWGKCKLCDRCPSGRGVQSPEMINIEMDPVHGALTCLGCKRCVSGKTFSSNIGFEDCQKCTNCYEEGLFEDEPCTIEENTKCINRIPVLAKEKKFGKPLPAEVNQSSESHNPESKTGGEYVLYFFTTFGVIVVIVPILAVIAKKLGIICRTHDKSKLTVDEEEGLNPRSTSKEMANPMTSLSNNEQNNIKIDPVDDHSTLVITQEQDESCHLYDDEDLVTDGREQGRADRVMTEKDILSVHSYLAHDNIYCELCRALGMSDSTIQIIKEECHYKLKESSFQCLKRWLELKGRDATIKIFERALRRIGKGGIVDKLQYSD